MLFFSCKFEHDSTAPYYLKAGHALNGTVETLQKDEANLLVFCWFNVFLCFCMVLIGKHLI